MPRSANSRATTGESSRSSADSSSTSTGLSSQRRPVKERATPNAAAPFSISPSSNVAAVARLDPAHRARRGPHHHAFGGDEIAMAVNAAQHRTVGDAGGREHYIARDQVQQTVFAVQVRN